MSARVARLCGNTTLRVRSVWSAVGAGIGAGVGAGVGVAMGGAETDAAGAVADDASGTAAVRSRAAWEIETVVGCAAIALLQ